MTAVLYIVPNTEPLTLSDTGDPLVYEKEIIYEGDFSKNYGKPNQQDFTVDLALMQHWYNTFHAMRENGIDVPVPVEHTQNPEMNRGKAIGMRIGRNKKGKLSLSALIKFRDAEAVKLAQTANVSLHTVDDFTDAMKRKYIKPIQHIALTDYPVIPGLEDWKPLAASYVGDSQMSKLREWAKRLKIANAETMPENELEAAIDAQIKEPTSPATPPPPPAPNPVGSNILPNTNNPGQPPTNNPTNNPQIPTGATPPAPPVSLSMVNMLKENRENKIDKLVSEGRISPAVATDLKTQHCSEGSLSLSLSNDKDQAFDMLMATLAKQEPSMKFGERTGAQSSVSLSNVMDPKTNPLLANAQKRAEDAKSR